MKFNPAQDPKIQLSASLWAKREGEVRKESRIRYKKALNVFILHHFENHFCIEMDGINVAYFEEKSKGLEDWAIFVWNNGDQVFFS